MKMIFFMQEMESVDELRALPSWKPHQLTGDRRGTWALHVTKNWRLTFRIDADDIEIVFSAAVAGRPDTSPDSIRRRRPLWRIVLMIDAELCQA